ncbi:YkyA family protein [Evansella tamaricis]|uniref:YkyA family protein n=1 Tax=Evansella tamaricis TaxID=2069301 RepID=UPI0036D3BA22
MKKLYLVCTAFMLSLFAAGCSEEQVNHVELMYDHLEEAVQIEKAVEDKQGPLTEAENYELELYEQLRDISDLAELEEIAQTAIESAEERRSIMEEEKAIIETAYDEFQLSIEYLDEIEDEEVKAQGQAMIEVMENRFETYQELFSQYLLTIDLDIELYSMYYHEDTTIEDLQDQHDLVNEAYQVINDLNQQFNDHTNEFNESKRSFYEMAELNVVFE